MLNKAIIFATNAHAGQFRKATRIPYIIHPLECAVITASMTDDMEMVVAAVLHDTVEDCEGVTIDKIEELFGTRVASFVSKESEDKTKTWQERKQATIDHLQTATKEECILVLADKLSNLRSIARDYKVLKEDLWNRFHEKRKERIAWYYRSIGDKLACLYAYPQYQEYLSLLEEVFGAEEV